MAIAAAVVVGALVGVTARLIWAVHEALTILRERGE